ncbi:hypothetical protein FHY18_004221 [Xanthomonas arboricola]|uniref:hypothetical protein n=1 Tax=Xanthomonas sp. 3793 TaxID=3035312 RepID=UPI002167FF3A|nr:hypothetical protein [Xanthomonas sp. 3793]MCS3748584.1 hypothetical protein [Xanthomonas sp. 3793]
MHAHALILLLPIALAGGCTQAAPSSAAPAATATAMPLQAPSAAAPATPAIAQFFRKDMTYSELRTRLLRDDWLPLREPRCWDNIGGDADVCRVLPEVDSCSADGYCIMRFANRALGLQAQITTYGPYDAYNATGGGSALKARSLDVQAPPRTPQATACPAQDFAQFLQRFAADETIQRQFTAPFVKAMELRSDGDGDQEQPVYLRAQDYRDFDLRYQGGAFHFVDPDGKVDAAPLRVQVTQPDAHGQLVRYSMNMSEGNSFLFEQRDGCWYLSEDPEAPAP